MNGYAVFFGLFVHAFISESHASTKNFSCTFERQYENDVLPCTATLYTGNNCSRMKLNRLYNGSYESDFPPARPDYYEIQPYDHYYKQYDRNYPAVRVVITPPKYSIEDIKGFEISFHDLSNPGIEAMRCVIVQLENITLTKQDRATESRFKLEIHPLSTKTHLFDLFSLPKPLPDRVTDSDHWLSYVTAGTFGWKEGDPSSKWITTISFRTDTSANEIDIFFTKPPDSYEFYYFDVDLIKIENPQEKDRDKEIRKPIQSDLIFNQTSYKFENVPKDWYRVSVMPRDDLAPSGCRCKAAENKCGSCIKTLTEIFYMNSTEPDEVLLSSTPSSVITKKVSSNTVSSGSTLSSSDTTTDKTSDGIHAEKQRNNETSDTVKTVVSVFGVLVAVTIIGVFSVFVCRRRRKKKKRNFSKQNGKTHNRDQKGNKPISYIPDIKFNGSVPPDYMISEKTVYIVNASDHPLHTQVVEAFVMYLQTHCKCKVLFYPWAQHEMDGLRWTMNSLKKAEFVILINSAAAFEQYEAWKNNEMYMAPSGDIFLLAFRQISQCLVNDPNFYHNLIMVSFDYTTTEVPKDIGHAVNFKLMEDLPKFLDYIHGPNSLSSKSMTSETWNLNEAIIKASKFEFTRQQNSGRLDSGICSIEKYDSLSDDWKKQQEAYIKEMANRDGISAAVTLGVGILDGSSVKNTLLRESSSLEPGKAPDSRPSSHISEDVFYPPDPSIADADLDSCIQQHEIAALNDRNTACCQKDSKDEIPVLSDKISTSCLKDCEDAISLNSGYSV